MRNKVNKLFETITPYRLCFDLGLRAREHKNGWYVIQDPGSNKNFLFFNECEFVSSKPGSKFLAGNIVDFLAYYKDLNYKDTVQYLLDVYSNQLNTPILSSIKWSSIGLADYLDKLHLLSDTFNKAASSLLQKNKFSKLRVYLDQYNSSELLYGKLAGARTGGDLNELTTLLSSCQHIKINNKNSWKSRVSFENYTKLAGCALGAKSCRLY